MAKPSSIPRKAFRKNSSHQLPSSPLRPKLLTRPAPFFVHSSSGEEDVQEKRRGEGREHEEEDEDDFNPFTSHKSLENQASSSSPRQKSQRQPAQAESSLWLFNEDRGADSTSIMQNVIAPWGLAAPEDEDISFTNLGETLQRAPSNNSVRPTGPASNTGSRVLSPVNDMASSLLSPTHKLTHQLYQTNNTTRRPLSSSSIVLSTSSNGLTATKPSNLHETTGKTSQQDPTCRSPVHHTADTLSRLGAKATVKSLLPPTSAMKNHHRTSQEPPKSVKKTRFAEPDENDNRFASSTSGSTKSIPGKNSAPVTDPLQCLSSPLSTNPTTGQESTTSASLPKRHASILESPAAPSHDQQTVNLPPNAKSLNLNTASDNTSQQSRLPSTTEPAHMIDTSLYKTLPTPLSPDRPLASRLQSSGRGSRSSRALSVEILSVDPADTAKHKDLMEKIKVQQMPLSSFKRLTRTNSSSSKVFQTVHATPTSVLQRTSSVSSADLLRPSRVVRTLASLSGAPEADSQVAHKGVSSGKVCDQDPTPRWKTAEAHSSSSLNPSCGPSRLVSNKSKEGGHSGESESSQKMKLSRNETSMSSEDAAPPEPKKVSNTDEQSEHLAAEKRRPSNRIHVSERAGSRLSALIELPTPNSTVEAINSGELAGIPINSNLSMVCQNGGVPQVSTPYSVGPVSLPFPPDTIHLSASRPRRSGRKSLNGNRDTPSRVKTPLVPLTFEDQTVVSHALLDTNQPVSNPPASSVNSLPSRNEEEVPDVGPITAVSNASETTTLSHHRNQDNMTNPSTSLVALREQAAPENQVLGAGTVPLHEGKKVVDKSINCHIDSEENASESQVHSATLRNIANGPAQAKDKMNKAPRDSSSRRPPASLRKPRALEQKQQTQRDKLTSLGIATETEIAPANTISPAAPILDARPPSPPHVQEEASDAPAAVPRLIRVRRPSVHDPAVSKKSRGPSVRIGESFQVPSSPSAASSVLHVNPADAVSKRSRVPPLTIKKTSTIPSNESIAGNPAPTASRRSASGPIPLASAHPSEHINAPAHVAHLVRVKRPSALDGDFAAAVAKKLRVPSSATGASSRLPNTQPKAGNPHPTTTSVRLAPETGPSSALHPPEVTDASVPEFQLMRVKRPSALDSDSASAIAKKSRVPSPTTGESSELPSTQSRAENPPSTITSTAKSVPDVGPSTFGHLRAAVDASASASQLMRVKRPSALADDFTAAVSKKSRVPSAATSESSKVPSNQSRVGNPHPSTISTARPAPDARPLTSAHIPQDSGPSAPDSQLLRVMRPSAHGGDSAAAVSKKSRVPSAATGKSSVIPSNQSRAGNPPPTASSTARSASDARPSMCAHLPEAINTAAVESQLIRVKRPSAVDGDSAASVAKESRVPSSAAGESSKVPNTQSRAGHPPERASGHSQKPSSSQPRPRVASKGRGKEVPSKSAVDLPLSNHLKRAEPVGVISEPAANSAECQFISTLRPHDEVIDPLSTKHPAVNNRPHANLQQSQPLSDKSVSLNAATSSGGVSVPTSQPPNNALAVSDTISSHINTRAASTESRCTVLLEAPSDFDAGHPVVDPETSQHAGAQPAMRSNRKVSTQSHPSGAPNTQPVKNNSLRVATNHGTTSAKPSNTCPQAPVLTLPKQFDFDFRSTLPAKPRIKDVRAQACSSARTAAPSRRPPALAPSQTKPLARPKPLARSRPDEGDADRASKRSRNNQSAVASPSRPRVGPSRPGLSNRVRSVVGRLNSLAKNAPAPAPSSTARTIRPKPSYPNRANDGPSRTAGAPEKTGATAANHTNRLPPYTSAHQSALRTQLMKEIRQNADMRPSTHRRAISNSVTPASQSSSENLAIKKTGRGLADIPEASQTAPQRVTQRNASGASSSQVHNSRVPEARSHLQASQNSRPASSGFQSCLNQWREVEARQSTNWLGGSLGRSVQSRKIPEWQDVSLVHHVLPVKDHSKPKKGTTISFGLATERRILEREHWEQTKANKEKIQAEIRAQEELKALELQREEFIRMRRECVVKANPIPDYLRKHL